VKEGGEDKGWREGEERDLQLYKPEPCLSLLSLIHHDRGNEREQANEGKLKREERMSLHTYYGCRRRGIQ
jgi:hypothetical protein